MEFIKGFTFGWDSQKGYFKTERAKESLRLMQERTASEYCIIALTALQETAHTTEIDYKGLHMVDDDELIEMIEYAKSLGLKVILKPTVNCKDGTWRAHINFFDTDVPCEPKWGDWFASYRDYQKHYARIAEKTACDMFIVGCEMVQTERKEAYWRQLIAEVRQEYQGLVTYNTDKYQEDNVTFWDALDLISSSGYYPINDWENQLDRIEAVIKKYDKPFFFAEAGCPSRSGSAMIPNDWALEGSVNLQEQADYYQVMFEQTKRRSWVGGFGLWDWQTYLHDESEVEQNDDYGVYGKPAEQIIKTYYQSR
ncbi:glycoside hydrolase family 113 [Amphibacillus sp. Q70]|uniref:glycoside hydrolase family 113 n=1 Tax=Amphibacillus sp. Q70 TaxID=3453416 RepID=UPI003F857B5E